MKWKGKQQGNGNGTFCNWVYVSVILLQDKSSYFWCTLFVHFLNLNTSIFTGTQKIFRQIKSTSTCVRYFSISSTLGDKTDLCIFSFCLLESTCEILTSVLALLPTLMRPGWIMPLWPWPAGAEVLEPNSRGGGPEPPEAANCCCCCWRRAWICCGDTEMG